MTSYVFVFGRTPELSFQEAIALYPVAKRLTYETVLIKIPVGTDLTAIINRLGGTIKIGEVVGEVHSLNSESLFQFFSNARDNIVFGISGFGSIKIRSELYQLLKNKLSESLAHVRYVTARESSQISSVVVKKQNVLELLIIPQKDSVLVAKTLVVQPYEEWSTRDYKRPHANPKAGMLPPKIARILVNIALGGVTDKVILDPFCGMGTIIAEALLCGAMAIGSDLSSDAITKSRENITWLTSIHKEIKDANARFIVCDATHVSEYVKKDSVDAIITEPYMGPSDMGNQWSNIRNILKGLEKLYIGAFRDWFYILKNGGFVMISIPSFRYKTREFFVKKPIDMCETLGYTKVLGPIEYSRPQAVIQRQFYLFRKN